MLVTFAIANKMIIDIPTKNNQITFQNLNNLDKYFNRLHDLKLGVGNLLN